MDETVRMVAEFFRAFAMTAPVEPSVPLTTPSETGQLLTVAQRMNNLSRDCWHRASVCEPKHVKECFLRLQLIQEELAELAEAMATNDPVLYLDALTDLQYVLDNAYVAFGFAQLKLPAFREVHASNMSKLTSDGEPLFDQAGRVVKSDQYRRPNLHQFVEGPCREESSTDASLEESSGA
jgi:predicted HAD superfamily Cof-like phosphohydrolase